VHIFIPVIEPELDLSKDLDILRAQQKLKLYPVDKKALPGSKGRARVFAF